MLRGSIHDSPIVMQPDCYTGRLLCSPIVMQQCLLLAIIERLMHLKKIPGQTHRKEMACTIIFALAMLIAAVSVAQSAENYNCGASTCICTGSLECQDMRNSVLCGGKVACHTSSKHQLICTCRRQGLKNRTS